MYKIIGGDQKEYGPVSSETIRQWLNQGRANAHTRVQAQGDTAWKTLGEIPEFAALMTAPYQTAPPPPPQNPRPLPPSRPILIGDCLSRGFALLSQQTATLFGATAIYILINLGITSIASIPVVGQPIALASLVIAGPLLAGLSLIFLRVKRGQNTDLGDLFWGFRNQFLQLFLAYLIIVVLLCLSALPGAALLGTSVVAMIASQSLAIPGLATAGAGLMLIFIPAVILAALWAFSLLLIADRRMDFWPAMELSRRAAIQRLPSILLLFIICGILHLLGALACGIGTFLTLPFVMATLACTYEDIFNTP